MRKRILVYQYRFLPLSQTFIYNQLRGLSSSFDLQILTHEFENLDDFSGFAPILVPRQNFFRKLTCMEDRLFLRKLASSDLFHVNFGHFALQVQKYAVKAGVPMTVHFHGVDASAFLRRPDYVEALKNSHFRAVFVCSEDMRQRLAPSLPKNMECLVSYYGTPVENFTYKQRYAVPDGAIFLQVSRLDKKKGIDVSIRAFEKYLRKVDPEAKFNIVGDGPLAADLNNLVQDLGIEESVCFVGTVSYRKVMLLLHAADVFLHPSVTDPSGDMEGIPNAICEAMATGLPVLSTFHSGIPELIEHGVNGFLAQEGDVQSLFEQMIALKKSDIMSLSLAARQKVEDKFDFAKTSKILAGYMNDLT